MGVFRTDQWPSRMDLWIIKKTFRPVLPREGVFGREEGGS
jgi:hypothetical protein